jgi:hypothetical protein
VIVTVLISSTVTSENTQRVEVQSELLLSVNAVCE